MPVILGAIRQDDDAGGVLKLSTQVKTAIGNIDCGKEGRLNMDKLADYGKKLNSYVLRNDGDVFELKKLADELNRDFYADVVEVKTSFCQ